MVYGTLNLGSGKLINDTQWNDTMHLAAAQTLNPPNQCHTQTEVINLTPCLISPLQWIMK